MKRSFILLVISMLCMTCYAQKKIFEKALAAGRNPNSFYVIHNKGEKKLKLEDLKEYARINGYLVGASTDKLISRFGDKDLTVETFEFLPKEEYPSFVYSNIKQNDAGFLTKVQAEGRGYFFMGWNSANLFQAFNDVKWSGLVSNGYIDGNGVGYVLSGNSKIVFVEGTFQHGFPVGQTTTTIYETENFSSKFIRENVDEKTITTGEMSDGMAMIEKNGVYGFVNQEGTIAITPQYKQVLQDFADGQAIVMIDNKESVIDRKGTFVDYSPHQKELFAEAVEMTKQGLQYYNDNDYSKAFELFKKAVEQDNASAQNNLGNCYYYGHGVAQDYEKAVSWYSKAMKQGDVSAQNNLGNCYYYGNGVPQSISTAVSYYREAAEQGDADAQYNLGNCYWKGVGVNQSFSSAKNWLSKSAAQGNETAINALNDLSQILNVNVKGYKLVKTKDSWLHLDSYWFDRLFTVLVDGKQVTSDIGESGYVKILDEHDYDGDGNNECLIQVWTGGNGIESTQYSLVYYDIAEEELEQILLDDDIWNEDPKAVLRDGKYYIVCKRGINTKTYVFNDGEVQLIDDSNSASTEAVMTYTMVDIFGVDNVGDLPESSFEERSDGYGAYARKYFDLDGDGVNETLEFISDTSHAFNWGESMSMTIIWSNGRRTDAGGGDKCAILKSKTKGMPDLLFSDVYLYKWDGKKYDHVQ